MGQTESWGGEKTGPTVVAGGRGSRDIVTCVRRRCRCMTGRGGRWWWVLTGGGSGGVSALFIVV